MAPKVPHRLIGQSNYLCDFPRGLIFPSQGCDGRFQISNTFEQVPEYNGNSTHDQEMVLLRNFHLKKYASLRDVMQEKFRRFHAKDNVPVTSYKAQSASEGRLTAKFVCPLEGCNSSFTWRHHLNSGLISIRQ